MGIRTCKQRTAECLWFFFSSRRRHTRFDCDWSSDVCSSDLNDQNANSDPNAPPSMESRRLSVNNCRTRRHRLAPMDSRSAISFWRAEARASRRLADRKSVVEGKRGESGGRRIIKKKKKKEIIGRVSMNKVVGVMKLVWISIGEMDILWMVI